MTILGCKDRRFPPSPGALGASLLLLLAGTALTLPTAAQTEAGPGTIGQKPDTATAQKTEPGTHRNLTPKAAAAAGPPAAAPTAPYTQPVVPPNAAPGTAPLLPQASQGASVGTAITQGASGPPGSQVLTLDQVVSLAVNSNSNVQLARQRLQKAQEQIVEVDAEARPQVSADLIDTYSSVDGFSTSGVTVASPSLPGGGEIPVVTDEGGGSTGSFTGGGGGGTANSNGAVSTTAGGSTSTGTTGATTGTGAGTIGGTSGSGTIGGTTGTGTIGGGTTTGTGGAGTGGAGTGGAGAGGAGTGGTGTGASTGTGGATGEAIAALPPIMQKYAQETRAGAQTTAVGATSGNSKLHPNATVTDPSGDIISSGNSGQRNNYSGRLSVTQYIDLFGLIPAARDVQKITRDFYALDLNRVQNETALSAKDYFFNVLRDQETVNVDQEQVNYAAANVRITQAQYTAGTAAQFDVLTAQVTLANDQQAIEAAQNQLNIDRANLNNLLGINPNTEISLQAPPLPPLTQEIDLNRSTQIAFQQRPELRQADNNIEIAKKLIKLAGASLQPTLGVGASANYTGPSDTDGTQSTFNLSAELNIPLYDGGTTRSKVRQAQVDLQTQLTTQGQLQQNVILEVRQAYLNVSNAQTQTSTAGVGVSQAEEAVRLAQVRYQNGLGTLLDVINAQAELATARNNLATAQYNYQTSLAQLIRAEGGR